MSASDYATTSQPMISAPSHSHAQLYEPQQPCVSSNRPAGGQSCMLPLLPRGRCPNPSANPVFRLDLKGSDGNLLAKRKRASKPKVRSGCITCKIRRVKCDERQPICARCEKAGVECDGYGSKPTSKEKNLGQSQTTLRKILPRPVDATTNTPPARQVLRANPAVIHIDESDVAYYDLFRHRLTRDLSGSFHSGFWSRVVLGESARDPCVKEAILAIAALSRTLYFTPGSSKTSLPTRHPFENATELPKAPLDHHHVAAMKHYIRAVSAYRMRIQRPSQRASPRTIIIMTVLLIAFEFIQGNMKTVDSLMATGMRLLEGSISLTKKPTDPDARYKSVAHFHSCSSSGSADEMEEIEHILPCISLILTSGFTDFFHSYRGGLPLMKSSPTLELPSPGSTPVAEVQTLWGRFYNRGVVHIMRGQSDHFSDEPGDQVDILREQRTFLDQIERWKGVLDAYLADPTVDDESSRRQLEIFRIHRLLMYVIISCGLDRGDMLFDEFEGEFVDIVDRCAALVRAERRLSAITFTLSEGLTPPLAMCISKCRTHDVRMRAARLLEEIARRDGSWDGKPLLIGKLGVALLEQEGMDEDRVIPLESRWAWKDARWDPQRRELTATYAKLIPGEDGLRAQTQLVLDMDKLPDICSPIGCSGDHDPFENC